MKQKKKKPGRPRVFDQKKQLATRIDWNLREWLRSQDNQAATVEKALTEYREKYKL